MKCNPEKISEKNAQYIYGKIWKLLIDARTKGKKKVSVKDKAKLLEERQLLVEQGKITVEEFYNLEFSRNE